VDVAYFRRVDAVDPAAGSAVLIPEEAARALWAGGEQMRGSAVSGALAAAAEQVASAHGAPGLRPVRWSLDLFRPAAVRECVTVGRVVRSGRRLCLVDTALRQGEVEVARGAALFLAPGPTAADPAWVSEWPLELPPPGLRSRTTEPRLYYSDGIGWTGGPHEHAPGGRMRTWLFDVPVVQGESPSPFQLAAMAGDVANLLTNWGPDGLAHINPDLGVLLARLPVGGGIGLAPELRVEHDGLVVGVTTLFDRAGTFGTASISALPSPSGPVDPRRLGDLLPEAGR
jgi:acyl-coenzyme A thioesterase PaaI-like protein